MVKNHRAVLTALAVASAVIASGTPRLTAVLASTGPPAGSEPVATAGGAPENTADAVAAESDEPVTLSLVGFAVPKAGNDAAQAAFAETPQGAGVSWETAYGASGDQSRAVAAGLPADYVHFSQDGDVTRLVEAGLVAEDWNAGPNRGIVTSSVVVLVVREGNPENIQGWPDLARDGIAIVTPNPGSSGAARWNVLAAYGSILDAGATEAEGLDYLRAFFDNVEALPGSGREATTAFLGGSGDVLISYENEAILARQNGEDFEYIVPDSTLRVDNPGAVLIDADPHARAYLNFVLSPQGQAEFASVGFRPIDGRAVTGVQGANDPDAPFPEVPNLLTIDDFGGWGAANDEFFDDDGAVTLIQQERGRT